MRITPVFVLLILALPHAVASADTLRCGSYLIQEGDDAFSVLAKCGEPTEKSTVTEPIFASNANGGSRDTGEVATTEIWRYNRGSSQFPVILRVSDGVVRSIHFVR